MKNETCKQQMRTWEGNKSQRRGGGSKEGAGNQRWSTKDKHSEAEREWSKLIGGGASANTVKLQN